YAAWWLLFAALCMLLARRRAWLLLVVVVLAVGGFVLLTALTYHIGDDAVMMEKNFLSLAVLVALPLAMEVERSTQRAQWLGFAAYVVVLFVQFRGISFASQPMRERYVLVQRTVWMAQEKGIGAYRVPSEELDTMGLHIHWALPYETLLVSGLSGAERCVVVRAVDDGSSVGAPIEREQLDHRWFDLPHAPERILSSH
ncbi:MAG TPA: hypothetical protein PK760_07065, partial [Flavobacteriales bacterium]|nr:hypothetical protein [Flavobacteriales bacterium]